VWRIKEWKRYKAFQPVSKVFASRGSSVACSEVDVAIVGGGPAGSAAACHLARHGCRVALIERTQFTQLRVGESLPPSIRPLLADLGVWDTFTALQPLPSYGTRSLWGTPTPQEHSHLGSPYGHGWHVDRLVFDRMLADAAVSAGAALYCNTTTAGCETSRSGQWRLQLVGRTAGPLHARLLLDATGRAAHLSRRLGAQRLLFDRLVGIAVLFDGIDSSQQRFILLETSPEGWWYSAPVPDNRLMVMLMTDSDLCGRAKLSTPERWCERLGKAPATRARASGTTRWGPRVFAAMSQRLHHSPCHAPWLALGDAALAVDPLTGSGVIRALRSARSAAEAVMAWLDNSADDPLAAYEAACDRECTTYLHERALYYGLEQRWHAAAFWQRRAAVAAQVMAHRL
jgi:flavin-dependent dehydrogenase